MVPISQKLARAHIFWQITDGVTYKGLRYPGFYCIARVRKNRVKQNIGRYGGREQPDDQRRPGTYPNFTNSIL